MQRTREYHLRLRGWGDVRARVRPVYYFGCLQGVRVTLLGPRTEPRKRTYPRQRGHVYCCCYRPENDHRAVQQALADHGWLVNEVRLG